VAVSTFGFGIHKRNPSLGVAQPRLGRSRARHHIRCRATRGGPINKLIRRASLCSDADLTLKPIFLLQRNNNAPRSFGNIGLPARPGGDQDHFRGTIPNRPRLAELLQDALAFSRISKSISTLGGIETLTLTPIRHWSPGNLKHATTREIAGQRQPIVALIPPGELISQAHGLARSRNYSMLQKSAGGSLGATIESQRTNSWIDIAHRGLILNQYCSLGCAKSFYNSICQKQTSVPREDPAHSRRRRGGS
jgi:hypothetical protein